MANLDKMEKDELIELVKQLQRRKKYGLVWEEKPEDVVEQCKKELPVLEEDAKRAIEKNPEGPTNLLIEGDNYHALSVLNYTHAGKIDVIYIDPPYNTGARDWKYNNDYVDINDTYRHSKWLSMMQKRLELVRNLLSKKGVLACTIDHNELNTLGLLLQEIFPKYEIVCVTIVHNPAGIQGENFSNCHEYAYFVYPKLGRYIGYQTRGNGEEDVRNFRDVTGKESLRTAGANCFYPIYVKDGKIIGFGDVCDRDFHPKNTNIVREDGVIEVYPIDPQGVERKWRFARQTVDEIKDELKAHFIKARGIWDVKRSKNRFNFKTVWTDSKYSANNHGTQLLNKIIEPGSFSFPKSIYAVYDCIDAASNNNKNAMVLDFFAGSGTTGHAVMMLNQADGGKRKFILCTNNELNGQEKSLKEQGLSEDEIWEHGICRGVTYPRIKKVIEGYNDTKGIPANLRYFKTSFVSKSNVSDDTRLGLVRRSTEMICVRENTFKKVADNKNFKIYKDGNHATGILFNLDSIEELKEKIRKLQMPTSIYVFSLTNDTYDEDFEDLGLKHELCPIPESILEVYRKLFKD